MDQSFEGWLIDLGHFLFILFIIIVPFSNDPTWLKYHADIVLLLVVKWLFLNRCTLVKFEKMIRGVSTQESFVYRFVEPLVDLRHHKEIWIPLVLLGCFSFYRWMELSSVSRFK